MHIADGHVHCDAAADRGLRKDEVSTVPHPRPELALLRLNRALVYECARSAGSQQIE